ncbi:MAG: hypothetical protein V3T60_14430 [Candidatus Binatia bacterium]
MKDNLSSILAAVGTLLLIGLFVVAVAPARADDVELRIKAVEKELSQLKGEQAEMKEAALAAKAKLPTFSYRQGRGMAIWAADRSWGFRTRIRWHHRLLYFESDALEDSGFNQHLQRVRRLRPYFIYFWDDGFYELEYQQNLAADQRRTIEIQKMELKIHFEKINPWLPFLTIGPRVSAFFNKHDTNWSSSSGGLFDRSMMQDGAGIGAGTNVNGMALDWRNLPVGPGRIRVLQFLVSNNGLTNQNGSPNPNTDNRAFHGGINYEPFQKLKNKWLKGIDVGFGVQYEQVLTEAGDSGRGKFRVRTTERQRLRLIEVNEDLRGARYYLTPGIGWKIGPYWLRTATAYNRGRFSGINGSRTTPGRGSLVKGDMWRVMHELWAWSPKGLLTGSHKRPGSIMLFTGFERTDYEAPNDKLRDCSSVTPGGECTRASAHLFTIGGWYVVRPGLEVGFEYGRYSVNKIGRGAADIDGVNSGDDVDFDTFELGIRVEW